MTHPAPPRTPSARSLARTGSSAAPGPSLPRRWPGCPGTPQAVSRRSWTTWTRSTASRSLAAC